MEENKDGQNTQDSIPADIQENTLAAHPEGGHPETHTQEIHNTGSPADGAMPEKKMEAEEEMKMEELLGPEKKMEAEKIVKVKIVNKNQDGVMVDLGVKAESLVPKEEFGSQAGFEEITVGTEIPVFIISLHSKDGSPVVSYKRAREIFAWEKIQIAFTAASPVEGIIKRSIKGGFIVDIGVDAFLPASQLEIYRVKDFNKYLGIKMKFLVTEIDRQKNNVVLSRRRLLEIEQKESKKRVLENIYENQIIDGVVTRLTDFGAFVDIGGMEGLLHIGDISWQRIKRAEDRLSVRQNVKVKILKIEGDKVSLGMKQLAPRPWDTAPAKYPQGTIVKGIVVSITDFGAFIEIEPGLEGLLHFSEVSWSEQKADVLKKLKVAQELSVMVIAVDAKEEKISLSLKKLKSNPWEEAKKKYPKGTRIKGVVTNLTPFGAFVKIAEGMEGLIHIAEMSWVTKIRHPKDLLTPGQEIEAVVQDINPLNEKISLSLKQLEENPYIKYRPGKVVTGTVKRVVDFGAFVELEPGIEALLRAAEFVPKTEGPRGHASSFIKVGQTIEAKVVKNDPAERKIDISTKKLEHDQERELLRKYVNKAERPTLGELLEEE